MSDKIKVLVMADYGCSTGFGQVASNVIRRLNETGKYEFTVIGINYDPINEIDPERWQGRIIPAITVSDMRAPDVYGRQKVLNELGKGIYDIFFTIQDTFIIGTIMPQILETQKNVEKRFNTVFYYPIDATPKKEWIEECVAKMDYPVPYTKYALEESIKIFPEVADKVCEPIYHGTNLEDFFYVKERDRVANFRKNYFNDVADGKFLITNINRNQPRKDVLRSFQILKELRDRGRDNALLYLHMAHDDAGGNLLVLAEQFGFELNKDYILPSPHVFDPNQGIPIEVLNLLYNASDCVLTTTLGEGWGLSATEALATRTPLVAPNNTSLTEMLADNRAYLVKSGATPSEYLTYGAQDNERIRPITNVADASDAIEKIMEGELPDLDGAEEWAHKYSWEYVCNDWKKIFEKASKTSTNKPQTQGLNRQQRRARERKNKKVSI